jgi:hypothetical protein
MHNATLGLNMTVGHDNVILHQNASSNATAFVQNETNTSAAAFVVNDTNATAAFGVNDTNATTFHQNSSNSSMI